MKHPFRQMSNLLLIALGVLSAGLGIQGFLVASGFVDGGITGISMLAARVGGWPLPLLIPIINLPFLLLGFRQMGPRFALYSTLAVAGLAVAIAFLHFPVVTEDKLLSAVFGGFFLGAGIGLAIRGGAVLDGTEIAALLISRNIPLCRVGDVILVFNLFIFGTAAFFLGIEPALYSVLTYLAASRTVDFLVHGIEEYTAVLIISDESEAIRQRIIQDLNRGVTVYKGRGGLSNQDQDILYCVVTRLEIGQVRTVAREIDPAAFIVVHTLAEAEGGVIKKQVAAA